MQDILIVGGGINGAGIARDAAGRGLAVTLVEQGDPGGATSWASSKLLHGGLRYLEHGAFGLVGEALRERSILLRTARHLAHPLTFVLPLTPESRPAWLLRIGLGIYDFLSDGDLPRAAAVELPASSFAGVLRPDITRGFTYADGQVDDARLVIANLIDARERGARILDRHRFLGARRDGKQWRARLANLRTGEELDLAAGCLVNAAGPWVDRVLETIPEVPRRAAVKLVRGCHIVVPRLASGDIAYTLQNDDGRVIFLLPFEKEFTLVGTTEASVADPLAGTGASPAEVDYLCRAASRYTRWPVKAEQVVWSFAGVRPLYDDGRTQPSSISRESVLQRDAGFPPALSVFGGKLTTYRSLAEKVMKHLASHFPDAGPAWTAHTPLPGSEGNEPPDKLQLRLEKSCPDISPGVIGGLVRRHGTRASALLGAGSTAATLGRDFGGGLTELEVRHFLRSEWAAAADDILWRRSKAGLGMTPEQRAGFAAWLQQDFGPKEIKR